MRKGFRFILSMALAAALVCGIVGCFAEEAPALEAGSFVTFGRYPQTKKGTDETPIGWLVLEVDEENQMALLISYYVLDVKPYNYLPFSLSSKKPDITWEDCSLRAWLNDEFLNKAFSQEEQLAIVLTDVDNSDEQGYEGWASGGNNTEDYIFLLSCAEAKRYFNVEPWDVPGSRENMAPRVALTDYLVIKSYWRSNSVGARDDSSVSWWLRSPGIYQFNVAYVGDNGCLYSMSPDWERIYVRPALWIDLESDIFNP